VALWLDGRNVYPHHFLGVVFLLRVPTSLYATHIFWTVRTPSVPDITTFYSLEFIVFCPCLCPRNSSTTIGPIERSEQPPAGAPPEVPPKANNAAGGQEQ
jgi:hypothetical protein